MLRAYFHSSVVPNPEVMQAELREVLRIAPRRVAERVAMADLLLHQSKIDEALAECETCRSHAPNDPNVELEFGLCHYRQGHTETAKLELESAVKALRNGDAELDNERSALCCTTLGQIASAERDFEGAARYYEEAVKLAPDDFTAHYALGVALKSLGKDELAKQCLQRSKILRNQAERLQEITLGLGNDPANVALRVAGATILREQGHKAEAMHWITSALTYEPKLKVAHEMLAELWDEKGEHEEAQRHREAARPDAPDGAGTSDQH